MIWLGRQTREQITAVTQPPVWKTGPLEHKDCSGPGDVVRLHVKSGRPLSSEQAGQAAAAGVQWGCFGEERGGGPAG